MSASVDSALPAELRAEMLAEIRDYLPAFLRKDASEQHDPIGDVKELLNLDAGDLKRVIAVHSCLDSSILAFGEKLAEAMRNPLASSIRPAEIGQAVRGPVDWSATMARRSLEAGNATSYVVRSARRAYDLPENRALVWLLERLRSACRRALAGKLDSAALDGPAEDLGWTDRLQRLAMQVERARETGWLHGVEAELPGPRTMQRLRGARNAFYRDDLTVALRRMLALESPDEAVLVDVLSERYFEPAATWIVFEVLVALRLARAMEKVSGRPRRARLLFGSGRAAFARYLLDDGSEVSLIYQAWPEEAGTSLLSETGSHHGLKIGESKPDLFVVRSGDSPDLVLLELKASYSASYLKEGLMKLLGYLADRPGIWRGQPAGWLVAPASKAFSPGSARADAGLWMVDSDSVADAVVARIVPAAV